LNTAAAREQAKNLLLIVKRFFGCIWLKI